MHEINLNSKDPFEEKRKQFAQSKLSEKLAEKYAPKSYEEENATLYKFSEYAAYFFQFSSIVTASTFVFSYVLTKINNIPFAFLISALIALFVLVCIEAMQHREAPKFFERLYIKGFDSTAARRLVFLTCLSAFSLFCSYSGGFDFAATVASKEPQFQAPTLQDIEQVATLYKSQIADAKTAAAEYRRSRLYLGKLSISDGNKWRKLLAVVTEKEAAMNAAIDKAKEQNRIDIAQAKTDHEAAKLEHTEKIEDNGGGLSSFAIIAQVLFFVCVWYREKYEYETAKQYAVNTQPTDPTKTDPHGGKKSSKGNDFSASDLDVLLSKINAQNSANQNRAKMRALPSVAEIEETELVIEQTPETKVLIQDIRVPHKNRQTGEVKLMNLGDIKANISANKSRLKQRIKKNASQDKIDHLKNIIAYWQAKEREVLQKIEAAENAPDNIKTRAI